MRLKSRRAIGLLLLCCGVAAVVYYKQIIPEQHSTADGAQPEQSMDSSLSTGEPLALMVIDTIPVKGRAPKTGYSRTEFGNGWTKVDGCDTRNIILHRDLNNSVVGDDCKVISGSLNDPYTGNIIEFKRGEQTSAAVQIDHVVALSNAWQTGAQQLTFAERVALANDPLELLAVDGIANQAKGDGDAATWLPPNKSFRCEYVARQIAVKQRYNLWLTAAEKQAMETVLGKCPGQTLPAKK